MLDDVIINNPNEVTKPHTFAVTHSLKHASLFDLVEIRYEIECISYQTFNTNQAEGRYLYLQRGIANQFTDYIFFGELYADFHAHRWVNGLTLTPPLQYLLQGDQEINQEYRTFYENCELVYIFLTGNKKIRSHFNIRMKYAPIPEFWIDVNVGYNLTQDSYHVVGYTDSRITAWIEAGFQLSFDGYNIDLLLLVVL